jgi:hypothetical protein
MPSIAMPPILLVALILGTAAASAAPWCAQYGGGRGAGTNCGFYTWDQCMAAISGNGGFCRRNAFEDPYWTGRTVQRRYRRGD